MDEYTDLDVALDIDFWYMAFHTETNAGRPEGYLYIWKIKGQTHV